jgi:hypothetical protein
MASVRGAVYLATDEGELYWLGRDCLPMHQRALLADFDWSLIRTGTPFSVQRGLVHLGDAVTVDCTMASRWVPPPVHFDRAPAPEIIRERVARLGGLIGNLDLPKRAVAIISDLACACSRQDVANLVWQSHKLIGMGPGLTPSGDDLVGGLLFTLRHLREMYPCRGSCNARLVNSLLCHSKSQTHLISYTLLRDHADGQGAEPFHRLLASVLDVESEKAILENARELIRIGNTSGTELLAGMLMGLKFLDRRGDSDDNRYQTTN